IEAMADAACLAGIPRAAAYNICSQAVLGSAKLALESPCHVAELKDMVCSPGGTTIEGVYALEQGGFRSVVMDSILAAVNKFNEMQSK
ncbi:MAG: pyrroline-5-carboxylate reductase, partial [Clostridiales bacterium]|nr:pyrroline-5-carboxylate reductase [Clostridiales bacterium]